MMNIKKSIFVGLVLSMSCSLLTGCMGEIADVRINKDGSGTVQMSLGLTEDAMTLMNSMGGEGSTTTTEELTEFEYNGNTYYGQVESVDFGNIAEFNDLLNNEEGSEEGEIDTGLIQLKQNPDKSFTLTLETNATTGDTTSMQDSIVNADTGIDEAAIELLMKDLTVVFTFTFPDNVKQTAGPSAGVEVDGKTLTLDFIEMGKNLSNNTVFTFTTKTENEVTPPAPVVHKKQFTDVLETAWYHKAVTAMADGGLVSGVGNNKFNPNGTLTYAQFCTILAKACSFEVGRDNEYWAYKAIQSCISAGFITDLGEINQKNYDTPISREAAVSAMYLAGEKKVAVKDVSATDIPDYAKISDRYKDNILKAYQVGITSGMDSLGTFEPKGNLTRAQICTLFYNLDWTTPVR